MLKILYGVNENTVDITDICLSKMTINNIINIPSNDYVRCVHFSDPVYGTQKYIYVILDSTIYKYSSNFSLEINTENNTITSKVDFKILYGIFNNTVDVTEICYSQLKYDDDIIVIPNSDFNRAIHFGDHLFGIEKKVFIVIDDSVREYNSDVCIKINIKDNSIFTAKIPSIPRNNEIINNTLSTLHSKLKIKHGSFNDELPEQKMAIQYLTGNEKILEIGGNIGRNSLIMSSILSNSSNLVTLESDDLIAVQLLQNKLLNNLNFHIEPSALSQRKLMQNGWDTVPSDTLQDGCKWVNTITLTDLKKKYNIDFDTLVLDCEGAFYYILMDTPEILDNINLIIMENDYHEVSHKEYIDELLKKNGFYVDYSEPGGWRHINHTFCPCENNFFEVWKKHNFSLEK